MPDDMCDKADAVISQMRAKANDKPTPTEQGPSTGGDERGLTTAQSIAQQEIMKREIPDDMWLTAGEQIAVERTDITFSPDFKITIA